MEKRDKVSFTKYLYKVRSLLRGIILKKFRDEELQQEDNRKIYTVHQILITMTLKYSKYLYQLLMFY